MKKTHNREAVVFFGVRDDAAEKDTGDKMRGEFWQLGKEIVVVLQGQKAFRKQNRAMISSRGERVHVEVYGVVSNSDVGERDQTVLQVACRFASALSASTNESNGGAPCLDWMKDAALQSRIDGGLLLFTCSSEKALRGEEALMSVISWRSGRIDRVCRATCADTHELR